MPSLPPLGQKLSRWATERCFAAIFTVIVMFMMFFRLGECTSNLVICTNAWTSSRRAPIHLSKLQLWHKDSRFLRWSLGIFGSMTQMGKQAWQQFCGRRKRGQRCMKSEPRYCYTALAGRNAVANLMEHDTWQYESVAVSILEAIKPFQGVCVDIGRTSQNAHSKPKNIWSKKLCSCETRNMLAVAAIKWAPIWLGKACVDLRYHQDVQRRWRDSCPTKERNPLNNTAHDQQQ